jgi:hypothetical protein
MGYDNSHVIGSGRRRSKTYDHRHYEKTLKPYQFQSAAMLLEDFWTDVDRILRNRGITP